MKKAQDIIKKIPLLKNNISIFITILTQTINKGDYMIENIEKAIKKDFQNSPDIIFKKIKLKRKKVLLIYNVTLTNSSNINEFILEKLTTLKKGITKKTGNKRAIFGKNENKYIRFCFVYVLFVQKYIKFYRNKQGPKR